MLNVNRPTQFPIIWGSSAPPADIRPIPLTSQIGVHAGYASFPDGFVPANFTPVAAGGVPPFGQDFNGILNQVTANLQWVNAGGPFYYSSSFATTVSGYPYGAVLASATLGSWWLNLVDANTSNPDLGGANWMPAWVFSFNGRRGLVALTGTDVLNALPGNSITNAYLATMFAGTIKGNLTGSVAGPGDFPVSALFPYLDLAQINSSVFSTPAGALLIFKVGQITVQIFETAAFSQNQGIQSFNFPVPFTTACAGVITSIINPTGSGAGSFSVNNQVVDFSRTGVRLVNNAAGSGGNATQLPVIVLAFGF